MALTKVFSRTEAMDEEFAYRAASWFAVASCPTRLRMLDVLFRHPDGALIARDLQGPVEVSQATIAHHVRKLCGSGLIEKGAQGQLSLTRDGRIFVASLQIIA